MIAFPLLANIPQGVFGTSLIKLVKHNDFSEVQHVNFFKLARRSILAGHNIQRQVDEIDNLAVALANAGRLHEDHFEVQRFQKQYGITEHGTGCKMLPARCNGPHINLFIAQTVHANSITQQRTACSAPRRIDSQYSDIHGWKMLREARQNFIGNAAFPGTARSGNTDDRDGASRNLPLATKFFEVGVIDDTILERGNHASNRYLIVTS